MNVIAFDYGAAQKKLAGSRGGEVSLQYPIHFFSCCISAMEIFLNKFSTICLAKKKSVIRRCLKPAYNPSR